MPLLIKNVEGNILETLEGNLYYVTGLSGLIQYEDYINLDGFIGYIQTLKHSESVTNIQKPNLFGLKNGYNVPTKILEISY